MAPLAAIALLGPVRALPHHGSHMERERFQSGRRPAMIAPKCFHS